MDAEKAFFRFVKQRYGGKVFKIERLTNPEYDTMIVRVEFHIPADEADEIEMYKRIISVIDVIAEGNDG